MHQHTAQDVQPQSQLQPQPQSQLQAQGHLARFVVTGTGAGPIRTAWLAGIGGRWRGVWPLWLPMLLTVLLMVSYVPVSLAAVDVNRANIQELVQIKGIGAKTAKRIIVERARGPFESLEHLSERLSGIGPKTVIKLRAGGLCAGSEQQPCADSAASAASANPTVASAARPGVATPEMLQFP